MKKRIEHMSYCKDGEKKWIAVSRSHYGRTKFYRNLTQSTLQRFEDIQKHSKRIYFTFDFEDGGVDLQISMLFDEIIAKAKGSD